MSLLPESSVDLVPCDPPFGITVSQWDKVVPFSKIWEEIRRVRKGNASTALFSSEPLSSLLRYNNLAEPRYDWAWEKLEASNFLLARKQSLKVHELIGILCNGRALYYPIVEEGEPYGSCTKGGSNWTRVNKVPNSTFRNENRGTKYSRSVKYFKTAESEGEVIHVNREPVTLLKYLIKTYTKRGDTVLDLASGNISTAIAHIHTNRKCICIERDDMYFLWGEERIRNGYNIKKSVE